MLTGIITLFFIIPTTKQETKHTKNTYNSTLTYYFEKLPPYYR